MCCLLGQTFGQEYRDLNKQQVCKRPVCFSWPHWQRIKLHRMKWPANLYFLLKGYIVPPAAMTCKPYVRGALTLWWVHWGACGRIVDSQTAGEGLAWRPGRVERSLFLMVTSVLGKQQACPLRRLPLWVKVTGEHIKLCCEQAWWLG